MPAFDVLAERGDAVGQRLQGLCLAESRVHVARVDRRRLELLLLREVADLGEDLHAPLAQLAGRLGATDRARIGPGLDTGAWDRRHGTLRGMGWSLASGCMGNRAEILIAHSP